jgi:hypothetical protein
MADGSAAKFDTAPYDEMGASFLAAQPLTVSPKKYADEEGWQSTFNHLEARLGGLRNWRWAWWAHWAVLAEFFLPRRYKWFVVANTMNRGRPINDAIIDSTGQLAVRICATGMYSGLTNPSRPWFGLEPALPWMEIDAEGKEWLEDTQRRLATVLHQSNFYTIMAQAFEDVTVFGTAPVIMYEDSEDALRCYLPCAGEYFLGASSRLDVDTLYREFTLTVIQIVEQFGLESCPEEVRNLWETGGASLESEFIVCHAIEPNFPIKSRGKGKQQQLDILPPEFVYREIYWLRGRKAERPLSKRGFKERPFFVARWSTVSNDAYSRSPCMDALGDTKQIQQETFRKAEFIEKGVRPPMGADPELKNEPASIMPGMITYVSQDQGKKGFWPLIEVHAQWLQGLIQDIAGVSERINRALFVDAFMAITRMQGIQPRNEMEITKRDLEKLQVLGPFIDRFENEFAAPAIKRALAIMERRRLLKPMPESIRRTPLKIAYVSIMRIAQAASEGVAMKDVLATAGSMSAAAKAAGLPDPMRILNLDKSIRMYAQALDFPESALFTDQEIAENDQAAQTGKAQAQVLPTTMAGVQAAKIASETPVGGDTLLSSILGGGQ